MCETVGSIARRLVKIGDALGADNGAIYYTLFPKAWRSSVSVAYKLTFLPTSPAAGFRPIHGQNGVGRRICLMA